MSLVFGNVTHSLPDTHLSYSKRPNLYLHCTATHPVLSHQMGSGSVVPLGLLQSTPGDKPTIRVLSE